MSPGGTSSTRQTYTAYCSRSSTPRHRDDDQHPWLPRALADQPQMRIHSVPKDMDRQRQNHALTRVLGVSLAYLRKLWKLWEGDVVGALHFIGQANLSLKLDVILSTFVNMISPFLVVSVRFGACNARVTWVCIADCRAFVFIYFNPSSLPSTISPYHNPTHTLELTPHLPLTSLLIHTTHHHGLPRDCVGAIIRLSIKLHKLTEDQQ